MKAAKSSSTLQKNTRPDAHRQAYLVEKKLNEKKKEKENPFDKFANARKKHDVLNRKVKGEDRHVGRARSKAIDDRKTKLLKDYNVNKKSNAFHDKRFGEDDADMSLEEKMFMRFQKERVKKARNSSMYNLDDGDGSGGGGGFKETLLTHKGQVLGESNLGDNDWVSSDDEESGGRLNKEVVNSLHFGGGMVQKQNSNSEAVGEDLFQKKNKLDALQEIVMKSKLHKMEKKEAKEEQETQREQLDKDYQSLIQSSMLDFTKIEKQPRYRGPSAATSDDNLKASGGGDIDDYDLLLREMTYESKVQAADRTKTPEEIALAEKQRIEALEKARIQRMKRVDGDADPDLKQASKSLFASTGGSAINKAKRRTDDDIDGDDFLPAGTAAKKKQQPELFGGLNRGDDGDSDDEGGDDESGEYDSEEDDDEDEDEDEEESDGIFSDEEEEDNDNDDEEEQQEDADEDEDEDSDDEDSDDEDEEDEQPNRFRRRSKKAVQEQPVDLTVNIKMPHKIDCPQDVESFDELISKYVRSDIDRTVIIDRIISWNNIHLPGPEGSENKNKLHNFLDVLLKHFVRVGDTLCEPNRSAEHRTSLKSELDHITSCIYKLCQDLPEQCVSLWGRTLKIYQSQLLKRLRDYSLGQRDSSCWPSLGRMLLLQILTHVFSVTDAKHDIIGPASLFICQCLSQCPVNNVQDISSGALLCSILVGYVGDARRFIPEMNLYINSAFQCFVRPDFIEKKNVLPTFNYPRFKWLREAITDSSEALVAPDGDSRLSWLCFSPKFSFKKAASDMSEKKVALSLLSTLSRISFSLFGLYKYCPATPELFEPILHSLKLTTVSLCPKKVAAVKEQSAKPKGKKRKAEEEEEESNSSVFIADLESTMKTISEESAKIVSTRDPLRWKKSTVTSLEMVAPKFQLDYTFRKNADLDGEQAKMKGLQRQLKREQKAAVRELRRDSDFLDAERFAEKTAAAHKRRNERAANYAFMEQQQATLNQTVRKGQGLMKGGGSSVLKKPRAKRM